jgi:hypothetical protein
VTQPIINLAGCPPLDSHVNQALIFTQGAVEIRTNCVRCVTLHLPHLRPPRHFSPWGEVRRASEGMRGAASHISIVKPREDLRRSKLQIIECTVTEFPAFPSPSMWQCATAASSRATWSCSKPWAAASPGARCWPGCEGSLVPSSPAVRVVLPNGEKKNSLTSLLPVGEKVDRDPCRETDEGPPRIKHPPIALPIPTGNRSNISSPGNRARKGQVKELPV